MYHPIHTVCWLNARVRPIPKRTILLSLIMDLKNFYFACHISSLEYFFYIISVKWRLFAIFAALNFFQKFTVRRRQKNVHKISPRVANKKNHRKCVFCKVKDSPLNSRKHYREVHYITIIGGNFGF